MELVATALGASAPILTDAGAYPALALSTPLNPNGTIRHRLPEAGATILRRFAVQHRRPPTSKETSELVLRIKREIGYDTSFNAVKVWFYRRREELKLKTAVDLLGWPSLRKLSTVPPKRARASRKAATIMPGPVSLSSSQTIVRAAKVSGVPSRGLVPLPSHAQNRSGAPKAVPEKRKIGGCKRPFPAEGSAILKKFAIEYGRYPSGKEAEVMVSQVRDKTGYNTTVGTVKYWFYKHRSELNLKTLMDSSRSLPLRPIQPQTVVSSARPNIGGNRRRYPKETIAILEAFALDYRRYPSADEARELIERAKDETGYQTTVKSIKYWFYQHRAEFKLKTLVSSNRALRFADVTSVEECGLGIAPTDGASASVLCYPFTSQQMPPLASAQAISPAYSLSQAQIEVLIALQGSNNARVDDTVVDACARSWAVDRRLIEDWFIHSQPARQPPTLSHVFTPIVFSVPLRPPQPQAHATVPQCVISLANAAPRPSPEEAVRGGRSDDEDEALAEATPFDQGTRGWSAEPPETGMMGTPLPLPGTPAPSMEVAMDPFVKGLVEALQEAIRAPPVVSPVKPTNAREFQVLWPASTPLADALDAIQLS